MSLTVIILSYNVEGLLRNALSAVYKTYKSKNLQVIVVDNASSDGSVGMVKREFPKAEIVISKINTGFSKGNNLAREKARGDYILFLNPDTKVQKNTINKCLNKLSKSSRMGAITCKVLLPNGTLDYSCHRGLPTPWNTFSYLSGLTRIFPKNKFFSGYSATYLDDNKSNFVDCVSGTFLMVKREVLDVISWWDEDYWWNGEDIEMCYQIKKAGYKIWYEASVTMIHYKGSSSGLWSTTKVIVPKRTKIRSAKSATRAMRIFLDKHWREMGPWPLMQIIRLGIFSLEKFRLWKIESGKLYK